MIKKYLKKVIIAILLITFIAGIVGGTNIYARAHTSVHSSRSSIKASTPKSSSKSTSVKASTPKTSTTKSKTTGKSYTTTKTDSGRTTIKHENVKPKINAEGKTTIVNNNPTIYTNYSNSSSFSLTNSIFQFYMLDQIFSDKESVTEQDVAKALEERGYTKEEIDQILDEAKQEEEINKPFYDGWKWYNWLLLVVITIAIIGGIVGFVIWLES